MAKKQGNAGRFKPGTSGNPHGRPRKDSLERTGDFKQDSIINALTGQGTSRDKTASNCFSVNVVDSESGMMIWRSDPIGARIIENPVNAALRQGYELCIGEQKMPDTFTPPSTSPAPAAAKPAFGRSDTRLGMVARTYRARIDSRRLHRMDANDDGKQLSETIAGHFESLEVDNLIKEAWCYARAGGGGALFIGANDFTTDLREPLDLKKVRSLDYLTPLEARELTPLYYYTDPQSPKFGLPAIYQMVPYTIGSPVPGTSFGARVLQVHESRLIMFHGPRVTRRNIYGANFGHGDSIFTRVASALMDWNASTKGAALLMADFAQAVYTVPGLAEKLAKNPNALRDKMVQTDLMRSICRAIILSQDENFERKATPMTGYPETMDRLANNVGAAAGQPLSLIFGQAPAGLDASGDSDIRWFYDGCAAEQQYVVTPALMPLIKIELAIAGQNPETTNHSIKFKSLWQPTEKEMADARFSQAQTDQIYIVNDVLSPEEVAMNRFAGDQYSFDTHVDFEARAAQEAAVAPTVDANPKPDPIPPTPGDASGAAAEKVNGAQGDADAKATDGDE